MDNNHNYIYILFIDFSLIIRNELFIKNFEDCIYLLLKFEFTEEKRHLCSSMILFIIIKFCLTLDINLLIK